MLRMLGGKLCVCVCVFLKLVNPPSCVFSLNNAIQKLSSKRAQRSGRYLKWIRAGLSSSRCLCATWLDLGRRPYLTTGAAPGRDSSGQAWAMITGWGRNIAKSFCDLIPRGTVSRSYVLSCRAVSYKLLTSVETPQATDLPKGWANRKVSPYPPLSLPPSTISS